MNDYFICLPYLYLFQLLWLLGKIRRSWEQTTNRHNSVNGWLVLHHQWRHDSRQTRSYLQRGRHGTHHDEKRGCRWTQFKINIFVVVFTTALARLKLYDILEQLGEQVLYYDTFSVIYKTAPGLHDVKWQKNLVARTSPFNPSPRPSLRVKGWVSCWENH